MVVVVVVNAFFVTAIIVVLLLLLSSLLLLLSFRRCCFVAVVVVGNTVLYWLNKHTPGIVAQSSKIRKMVVIRLVVLETETIGKWKAIRELKNN